MPASSLPPSKKLKTVSAANGTSKSDSQAVEELEKAITAALANNASLNPLADLLHIASSSSDADIVLKAIFALYRLFTIASQKGILTAHEKEESGRRTVRAWVAARLDAFANLLCELLQDEEKTLRVRLCTVYSLKGDAHAPKGICAENFILPAPPTLLNRVFYGVFLFIRTPPIRRPFLSKNHSCTSPLPILPVHAWEL